MVSESHSLLNCADLPAPKILKTRSSLIRDRVQVLPHLAKKNDYTCKGSVSQLAFSSGGYKPNGFASNAHNELQALRARVLKATPVPNESLLACIDWAKKKHRHLFPNIHNVKSVPFAEYLLRSNASPSVKRVLQKTFDRLVLDGFDETSNLSKSKLYQWTKRSSFVKVENDLYSTVLGRKNKAPRLIQGAQPEFIVLVGPWIMALQDAIKGKWTTKSPLCFTSGVTAEAAGAYISDFDGEWLEDDIGSFDSSVDVQWCEYEVWLCTKFRAPKAVVDLIRANIHTHGKTHHGWKYKCEGTRKSGDPYTSLFNSVINGLCHLHLFCTWENVTVKTVRAHKMIKMLLQGDDNLLRHPFGRRYPWVEGMRGLGFDSEAIYRDHYFEAEFCSSRLYKVDNGDYVFGPKPGRVLAKYGYVINPPPNVNSNSLLRGIALGLKRAVSFIPPLKSVTDRTLQLTEGNKAVYMQKRFSPFDSSLPIKRVHNLSVDVYLSLNHHYDWDYSKQSSFVKTLDSASLGDELPYLSRLMLDRDTGGPQDIFGQWVPSALVVPIVA